MVSAFLAVVAGTILLLHVLDIPSLENAERQIVKETSSPKTIDTVACH